MRFFISPQPRLNRIQIVRVRGQEAQRGARLLDSRPQGQFEVVRGSMHESETEVLARSPGMLIPFDWSADGRLLL
jgi:hypothetical protein